MAEEGHFEEVTEFRVRVEIRDGIGHLRWARQRVSIEVLERAISLAADDALLARNLRRLQVELPITDRAAIRAVQRCGFRREGILRQAHQSGEGTYLDVGIWGRLATDVVNGPLGFSGVMDSVLPTKRVIGHAVFTDTAGRVLLAETTYKDDWELPGGVVEPGETPREGTQREILEEIGLAFELGDAAIVDWMPASLNWSDAIQFVFHGGQLPPGLAAAVQPADREIRQLHWVAPTDLEQHVTPLSARRIRLVLAGEVGLTEDGLRRARWRGDAEPS